MSNVKTSGLFFQMFGVYFTCKPNDGNQDFFTLAKGFCPRIYKEGKTERAIILCKPNKSLLESSKSVGIHRKKSLYSLKNFVFNKPVGPLKCEENVLFLYDF